jgi:hypothetical protein
MVIQNVCFALVVTIMFLGQLTVQLTCIDFPNGSLPLTKNFGHGMLTVFVVSPLFLICDYQRFW